MTPPSTRGKIALVSCGDASNERFPSVRELGERGWGRVGVLVGDRLGHRGF